MARRRRFITSLLPGRREADAGFTLIEVIVALALLVTVMATTAGFFTTSLKQSNGQTQAQQATALADQQLDYTRSVTTRALLSGRTQAAVAAAVATPPLGVDLSQDVTSTGNWDTSTQPPNTATVPISMTTTVGGTKYTIVTFVDQCYLTAKTSADCKSAVTSYGWVYRITVDVTYQLGGGRSCAGGKPCHYVASTLRDSGVDPCFNVQTNYVGCSNAQPAITDISPNSVTTNSGTTVTLTGKNFDAGATVSLDTGGTVSNVNVISSSLLTFTLTAANDPSALGSRTVKVTNPNAAFAYGTMTITTSAISVNSVTPSPISTGSTTTLTIAGSGFQSGSVVSVPAAAGTIVSTPLVTANAITLSFTAGSTGSATGAWPVTVTNPDGNSGSANLTIQKGAINVISVSPSTLVQASTCTFTISGTGFNSGAQVTLDGANVSEQWVSSTTITVTLTSDPSAGTHTFTVTNPDGAADTGMFTVTGGPAQITDMSPTSFQHDSKVSVTITGSGFVPTGGGKPSVTVNGSTSGVSKVTVVDSSTVTFTYKYNSQYYGYLPVQVTSRDGSMSDVYSWGVWIY